MLRRSDYPSAKDCGPKSPSCGWVSQLSTYRRSILTHVDSDDDASDEHIPPAKKVTSQNTSQRTKEASVDASAYFSGKNKVNRTVPVRESRPRAAQKAVTRPVPQSVHDDDDGADDIFIDAFQKRDDDYQEDPDDQDMDDVEVEDNKGMKAITPGSRGWQNPAIANGKRKMAVSDNEESDLLQPVLKTTTDSKKLKVKKLKTCDDDEEFAKLPLPKNPTKKSSARKAPPKKINEPVDNSEVRRILDSIPMVRPPTPPPRAEGKKFNFKDIAGRSGPAAPGSKLLPTGADNCLAGLTFVFTGILDSISREEGQQLVKKYGGKVTTSLSKKTSYVVLGHDAGPKKLEHIRTYGIKSINEDGLFKLIRSLPANGGDSVAAKHWEAKRAIEEKKVRDAAAEMHQVAQAEARAAKAKGQVPQDVGQLWTTKYAPTKMNEICGNKGQVEKLQRWLHNWPKNLKLQFKLRGPDGNGVFRAVMVHGPPGIGKTTAAHLVAKLEGYDILEYNASDTRSKKLMEETMRGVLDNTSLMGYFAPVREKVDISKKKLVLIMDEVDGMSAGDRGGVGQLAMLCKKTSVSFGLVFLCRYLSADGCRFPSSASATNGNCPR